MALFFNGVDWILLQLSTTVSYCDVSWEKRAVCIILPDYHTGIERLGFKGIEYHHNHLCRQFFSSIENNEDHKLRELLPAIHESRYNLRNSRKYKVPPVRTNWAKNSFILSMCRWCMSPSHNMGSDDVFLVSVWVSSHNTEILVESLSNSLLIIII